MNDFQTLSTRSFDVSYRASGAGRRIAILIHASASSPTQWRALMNDAETRRLDLRLYAPALTGYAGTRHHDGRAANAEDDVDALAEFIDNVAAGEAVDIVGHSYGAATALWFALERPEAVRTLTLFEPVVFDALERSSDMLVRRQMAAFMASQVARVEAGDLEGAAHDFVNFWNGAEAWQHMTDAQRTHFVRYARKVASEWRRLERTATDLQAASRLQTPLCILSGASTPAPTRALMDVLQAALPNASHHRIAGVGHLAPMTDPQRLNPLILDALANTGSADVQRRPFQIGNALATRIRGSIFDVRQQRRQRQDAHLLGMPDRELRDLAIGRSEIASIVRGGHAAEWRRGECMP